LEARARTLLAGNPVLVFEMTIDVELCTKVSLFGSQKLNLCERTRGVDKPDPRHSLYNPTLNVFAETLYMEDVVPRELNGGDGRWHFENVARDMPKALDGKTVKLCGVHCNDVRLVVAIVLGGDATLPSVLEKHDWQQLLEPAQTLKRRTVLEGHRESVYELGLVHLGIPDGCECVRDWVDS
jgi:hypothetical protein